MGQVIFEGRAKSDGVPADDDPTESDDSSGEIKPRITLSAKDYESLLLLARGAANSMPDLASILAEELERAHVLADNDSEQSVCMGKLLHKGCLLRLSLPWALTVRHLRRNIDA
jgi:hypothetical protein